MRSNSDEVEKNNDCFRNLHLTTAYGGASPQGEAFDKLHLNLMLRNMDVSKVVERKKPPLPKGRGTTEGGGGISVDSAVKESLRQSATDISCESPSHLR